MIIEIDPSYSGYYTARQVRTEQIKAMMDPLVKHIDSTSGEGDLIELRKSEWPEQYRFMNGVPKLLGRTVNWI